MEEQNQNFTNDDFVMYEDYNSLVKELEVAFSQGNSEECLRLIAKIIIPGSEYEQSYAFIELIHATDDSILIDTLCSWFVEQLTCDEKVIQKETMELICRYLIPHLIQIGHKNALARLAALLTPSDNPEFQYTRELLNAALNNLIAVNALHGYPLAQAEDPELMDFTDEESEDLEPSDADDESYDEPSVTLFDSEIEVDSETNNRENGLGILFSQHNDRVCKNLKKPTNATEALELLIKLLSEVRLESATSIPIFGCLSLTTKNYFGMKNGIEETKMADFPPYFIDIMDKALLYVCTHNAYVKKLIAMVFQGFNEINQTTADELIGLLHQLPKCVIAFLKEEYKNSVNNTVCAEKYFNGVFTHGVIKGGSIVDFELLDAKNALAVDGNQVYCFDFATGKRLKTFGNHLRADHIVKTSSGFLTQANKSIKIWDLETGLCVKELYDDFILKVAVQNNVIFSRTFEFIKLFNAASGEEIKRIAVHHIILDPFALLEPCVFANNNNVIIPANDNEDGKRLEVWNLNGMHIHTIYFSSEEINSILMLDATRVLVQGFYDLNTKIFDLISGKKINIKNENAAAIASLGNIIISINDQFVIKFFDSLTGNLLREIPLENFSVVQKIRIVNNILYIVTTENELILMPLPSFEDCIEHKKSENNKK